MKVLKFGGTSVGSPERMKGVSQLINDGDKKIATNSFRRRTAFWNAAGSLLFNLRKSSSALGE